MTAQHTRHKAAAKQLSSAFDGLRRAIHMVRGWKLMLTRNIAYDKGLQVETVLLHGQRTDGLKIILRNFGCSTQGLRDELENRIVSMLNYKHRNTDWYIGSAFSHIPGTNMIQQRVEHE